MKIKQVVIENFRGIKKCKAIFSENVVCFVGPGDSCKTTLLDAIEFCFMPAWNPRVNDADFYDLNPENTVCIEAVVGDVPQSLLSDTKFGLDAKGWHPEDGLIDEPIDGTEKVLHVRFRMDKTLEPSWFVLSTNHPDGIEFRSKERSAIGVTRIGTYVDRQLTWSRNSMVSKIIEDMNTEGFTEVLASAVRNARAGLCEGEALEPLKNASQRVADLSASLGVSPNASFEPKLDVNAIQLDIGGMSLHDGNVPVGRAGMATKRLVSLALQIELAKKGGIALIDEIELGLEPYRIRHLIQNLKMRLQPTTDGENQEMKLGQVFMTTHNTTVIAELDATNLHVTRRSDEEVRIFPVDQGLQDVVRGASEALLNKKVIICEGPTEVGLMRSLDKCWQTADRLPAAYSGIVFIDGKGSNAPKYAEKLRSLGYEVLFFGDSDEPITPTKEDLERIGVETAIWPGQSATENQIFFDLPWPSVCELLNFAGEKEESGFTGIRDATQAKRTNPPDQLPTELEQWLETDDLRIAIGKVAKAKKWFKRTDYGEKLGAVTFQALEEIAEKDLSRTINKIRRWIDGTN